MEINTNTQHTNNENLVTALNYIDVTSLSYEDWFKIGTALKTEGIDFVIWDNWSKNDSRYKATEMIKKWDSFKEGTVTGGTIIEIAKRNGYTGTTRNSNTAYKKNTGSSYKKELSKERLDEIKETIYRSKLNIDSSEPVKEYLAKRGISLDTAHLYGLGTRDDTALLIPTKTSYIERYIDENSPIRYTVAKDTTPEIFNEKVINSDTKSPIYVCEGAIDALSILQEGYTAIALCSTTHKTAFVEMYKATNCKAPVILCLDNDRTGQDATEAIEKALDGQTIVTRLNIPTNYKDINDWYVKDAQGLINELKTAKEQKLNEYKATSNAILMESLGETFKATPIKTGYKQLDFALSGGLYDGLYMLGATTGQGKTTYALQLCDQIAQQGNDVLIFSLEMSTSELIARSLSRTTWDISTSKESVFCDKYAKSEIEIRRTDLYNKYTQSELEVIDQAKGKYKEYATHIFTTEGIGNINATTIKETIEKHIALTGNKPVVLIDYIQLLAPITDKYTDIRESIDKNILELKRITRDLKLPIIAISSMNRGGYKSEANNSNFKESGSIEYTATVTMQLTYKPKTIETEEQQKSPREIELHIMKNRQGIPGGTIEYKYYSKFNKFVELNENCKEEAKKIIKM